MGTFDAADARFRDWRSKLIALLRREKSLSARDIDVLLRPPRREHVANVTVSYLSFPVWLAKYDHALTRGLQVNLNSYRAQREKHVADVTAQLDLIAGKTAPSLAGQALLSALPDPKGFLNNAQNVNVKPRELVARFKQRQVPFYRDLARIPADRAAFNPIREHHEEQRARP